MSVDPQAKPDPTQNEIDEAEWAKAENWKLGMFYSSHRDSRVWVPKRTLFGRRHRVGGTPNMAKPEGRLYILVISSLLLGILLVLMVLKRLGIT